MTAIEREEYESPFPCFVCGKKLKNVVHPEQSENQPYYACTFTSRGHYGSQIFDEMDGAQLVLNICDNCLIAGKEREIVGYRPGYPKRPLSPWKGE